MNTESEMARVLYGPINQIVPMTNLPTGGPIPDEALTPIRNGGICVQEGRIAAIGPFEELRQSVTEIREIEGPVVALPGFIDAHSHICFAGSRAGDYALRLAGKSYLEIAAGGGGILETMRLTSEASEEHLIALMARRLDRHLSGGVTTCEIKSGYGTKLFNELTILNAIAATSYVHSVTLVPTCLSAHVLPPGFANTTQFLNFLMKESLPRIKQARLASRCDIFVDEGGFGVDEARKYLLAAKAIGYRLCVHADQFTRGGAALAAEVGALSADHLEMSTQEDFDKLHAAKVIPIVLPGSSLGLGMPFAKARAILDTGLPLVIASDWNPGSAPMGDLLTLASLLGMNQRLTTAETFAALTVRAARALDFNDRGTLQAGKRADFVLFPTADYRDILYQQGWLRPSSVYVNGQKQKSQP